MLLDSNIIVIASKLLDVKLLTKLRAQENHLCASLVTQIEVLGYHQLKQTEKSFLENFFNTIPIFGVDNKVAQKAIELRQKSAISLADSIIAATAFIHDKTLLTDNTKDFSRLKDLKLISRKDFIENWEV